MIKRLLELRPFLEDMDNPKVSLTEAEWKELAELESVLVMPYLTTKKITK